MIYGGTISTPANTTEASPLRTVFNVTEGIVYHLKVYFPPGPAGLLHVQLYDGTYLMFPTTLGQSFSGDNVLLQWDVLYAFKAAPYLMEVRTWNLDDTYSHDAAVYLSMETADEFKARYLPLLQTNQLVTALGEKEVATEAKRQDRVSAFLETLNPEEGE